MHLAADRPTWAWTWRPHACVLMGFGGATVALRVYDAKIAPFSYADGLQGSVSRVIEFDNSSSGKA